MQQGEQAEARLVTFRDVGLALQEIERWVKAVRVGVEDLERRYTVGGAEIEVAQPVALASTTDDAAYQTFSTSGGGLTKSCKS